MAMQLTVELVVSLIVSAGAGATVAYFGNRIANSELLGHVRRHCKEIERIDKLVGSALSRLGEHREKLAVLWFEHEQRMRGRD